MDTGTWKAKTSLAQMLKGGVIMGGFIKNTA
jgi:pyridoxal biosynthesis lyase PdxS